ncbi:hypothetical protein J4711_14275 [Staphylococcus epidermidis]|nr:hypothetical protein [Staphylococcus epidermidis]
MTWSMTSRARSWAARPAAPSARRSGGGPGHHGPRHQDHAGEPERAERSSSAGNSARPRCCR